MPFTTASLTDPESIKALAHPGRFKILVYLQVHGPATATECAKVALASPSACSYHLRKLSRWGLVEEIPSDDGRERRWGAQVQEFTWESAPGSPEQEEAAGLLSQVVLRDAVSIIASHLARGTDRDWGRIQSSGLLVTAAELTDISDRVLETVRPYFLNNRLNPPSEARLVQFLAAAAPRTGD